MMYCQSKLISFVEEQHKGQVRKYTGEPYINHLLAVARMADGKVTNGFEIGLCHDLFEDTSCNLPDLFEALLSFGYPEDVASDICDRVDDLSDVYTPDNSPELKRKYRKHLEALRLHAIHPDAQTVKYLDLLDNAKSIIDHDKKFARVFISEMQEILSGMYKGDAVIYADCLNVLEMAKKELC